MGAVLKGIGPDYIFQQKSKQLRIILIYTSNKNKAIMYICVKDWWITSYWPSKIIAGEDLISYKEFEGEEWNLLRTEATKYYLEA